MKTVVLSKRAERDLRAIGEYIFHSWGLAQAEHYVLSIRECCQLLAERPRLGRPYGMGGEGVRRIEHSEHVIFYKSSQDQIVVSRILHRRMLPTRHSMQD